MKQFFEQYGGIALGILALLVLIAMITPVGNIMKTSLQGTVHKFSTSIDSQTDSALSAANESQKNAEFYVEKGTLIKINGMRYRILSVDGANAKVLSLETVITTNHSDSSNTISIGSENTLLYAGSKFDNAMNNYYESMPTEIKNAIVPQNIKQTINTYNWTQHGLTESQRNGLIATAYLNSANGYDENTTYQSEGNESYYILKQGEIEIGERYVYLADLSDILEYIGTDHDILPQEMSYALTNSYSSSGILLATRSTRLSMNNGSTGSIPTGLNLNNGDLMYTGANRTDNLQLRPSFVIDLSRIDYEVVER